jgi:hypothetical protein
MPEQLHVKSTPISLPDLSSHAGRGLFAVLDSCDEPQVLSKLEELGPEKTCLYSGKAVVKYQGFAPYLVEVDDDLLAWIVSNLSERPWGIFMLTAATLAELRKHLRRFLLVKMPDDRTAYFRFYDPRVIPTFLESCDPPETAAFFGPINRFVVPDETNQQFVAYARDRG